MNPLLTLIWPAVEEVLDRLIPDKAELAKAKADMEKTLITATTQVDVAQAAINEEQAKSQDKFVARARPFFMWVCGIAFAYHFIVQPFLAFAMAIFGHTFPLPVFDMDSLYSVTMGMLGLSGMRTYEKFKGVT